MTRDHYRLDAPHADPGDEDDFEDDDPDATPLEPPDRHEVAEIIAEHKWEMRGGR